MPVNFRTAIAKSAKYLRGDCGSQRGRWRGRESGSCRSCSVGAGISIRRKSPRYQSSTFSSAKGANFAVYTTLSGGARWTIGVGDSMGPRLQSLSSTRSDTRCVGGRAVAVPFFGRAVRKIIAQAECPDQDPLRQETQGERRALATHRGCSVASAATSRLRECRRHAL